MKDGDLKPLAANLLARLAHAVQAGEDKSELIVELPREVHGQ